jgi:hypothetical protein
MPTHTFDLHFLWNPKDELAPPDASAQIVLKSDITVSSRNGKIAITTECANVRELEQWVALLNGELDQILVAGRKKFAERDNLATPA